MIVGKVRVQSAVRKYEVMKIACVRIVSNMKKIDLLKAFVVYATVLTLLIIAIL